MLKKQNADLNDADDSSDANGELDGDVKGWEGIEDVKPIVPDDEEYVDEDKYTTVTVEAMGESDAESNGVDEKTIVKEPSKEAKATKKRIRPKDGDKTKKKKFRYESKAERSAGRQKLKAKSHQAKVRRKGK